MLLCAEQNVGHLNKMHFQEPGDSCEQNKPQEISTNELLGILGLLCAEQNLENLESIIFKNYGTPVRRTKRQKSQTLHLQKLWDSCAQNNTLDISKTAPS